MSLLSSDLFRCSNFEIVEYSPEILGLICYNSAFANKVNNWLNYYPDAHIKPNEEALFKIPRNVFHNLYDLLPQVNQNKFVQDVFTRIVQGIYAE